jgi:periplasmic protein TonB
MALSHDNLSGPGRPPRGDGVASVREAPGHGVDLEATLPPTPVRELLAASGASLFVLATDADFVAAIRRAAGDRYPLFVVDNWNELKDAADSGRCGIALLDAALLGRRVGECIAALATHADRLVTLVAADRAAAHEYVGLLSDGRIHRLLIKPPAIGATRLLIDSAVARRLQLRDASANDDAPPAAAAPSSALPRWGWTVAAAVVAVVLLATAITGSQLGWWNGAGTDEAAITADPAAAPAAPAVENPPSPTEQLLAERRASAALALQEGRLAEPAGDNALEHYLAILALEPGDQGARSQLSGVVQTLFTSAEEALLAGELESAAAALDHVRRVDPASSRLAFLDAQLARSLAALAAPASATSANPAPPPVATGPTELDSVLSLAAARLRRGQLLVPTGDSAQAYLDRAAGLAATDPRVVALRADLTAALLAAARLVSASDVAAATTLAGEARRLGGESAALVALERDIGAARVRDEQRFAERLATARERVQSGALFAPPNDSALDHLSRLQADAPGLTGLAEAWDAFRAAGTRAITNTIATREWARAETELEALTRAPGGAIVAAPLAAELAARRQQETYLATAAPPSALTLLSSVPVVYPMEALELGIEGWVDVDFIVDREGQPRDISVVDSSPPGRFNAAAVAAVQQYRYVPFEREGRVYERRIRFRLRFQIQ